MYGVSPLPPVGCLPANGVFVVPVLAVGGVGGVSGTVDEMNGVLRLGRPTAVVASPKRRLIAYASTVPGLG